MQKNELKKNFTSTVLEKVQLKNIIKVVVPDEITEKIKYLCNIISNVEWSGILLYETQGDIKEPDKMVILIKDIILMDKGSSTFTEYSFNEKKRNQSGYTDRHIDYCEEFEDAIYWQIGLIHSHQAMQVFFSQTDLSELEDNAPSHNYYLSMIVNNKTDIIAKVAFIGEAENEVSLKYFAQDSNGKQYVIESDNKKIKEKKLFIYDCKVEYNRDVESKKDFFQRNLQEVLEDANRPKQLYTEYGSWSTNKKDFYSTNLNFNKPKIDYNAQRFADEDYFDGAAFENIEDDIEQFAICLLNGTNMSDEFTTIEDLLNKLKLYQITGKDLASSVVNNYIPLFQKYYEEHIGDEVVFLEVIEETIDLFKSYSDKYKFLYQSVLALENIMEKFLKEDASTI